MTRWQEQVREKLKWWEGWEGTTGVEIVPGIRVAFADDAEAASFVWAVNAGPCGGLPPETLVVVGVGREDVEVPLFTGVAVEHRWSLELAYRPCGWNCITDPLGEYHRLTVYRGADFDAIRDAPGA